LRARRSKLEQLIDVLGSVEKEPLCKTRIMALTGLDMKHIKLFISALDGCLKSDIGEDERGNPLRVFELTSKGREILQDHRKIMEKLGLLQN
jgi:predicted transcriptional regulator